MLILLLKCVMFDPNIGYHVQHFESIPYIHDSFVLNRLLSGSKVYILINSSVYHNMSFYVFVEKHTAYLI